VNQLREHIDKAWGQAKKDRVDGLSGSAWLKNKIFNRYDKSANQKAYQILMKDIQAGNISKLLASPLVPDEFKAPLQKQADAHQRHVQQMNAYPAQYAAAPPTQNVNTYKPPEPIQTNSNRRPDTDGPRRRLR
jgi:hypothetical protein